MELGDPKVPRTTSESADRARVLIVDDHPPLRAGLELFLDQEDGILVCGGVGDGSAALEAAAKLKPDLILFDITLGKQVRLDLIPELLKRAPHSRVLVLSAHPSFLYARRCLEVGAHGYVCKGESVKALAKAIRIVVGGRVYVKGERSPNETDVRSTAKLKPISLDSLTNRELQVFMMIGMGSSIPEIAQAIGVSVNTVEVHRENARRKLGLSSAEELLRYAVIWVHCRGIG